MRIAIENGVVSIGDVDGVDLPPELAGRPLAGYRIDDGVLSWNDPAGMPETPEQAGARLATLRASIKAAIDVQAERERLRYITGGAGQAMTYARKVDQARAVLVESDPQPADYPMLAASIGIDGADLLAVAGTIIAMDAAWEQIGAAIEAARLSGKRAVDLAVDLAAVQAVVVSWPNPGAE